MELIIDFGGFYESIHSGLIDSRLELDFEYYLEEENFDPDGYWDSINYRETFRLYAIDYTKDLFSYIENEYIEEELELEKSLRLSNIDLENLYINSPREYNFSTDKIVIPDVSLGISIQLKWLFGKILIKDSRFRQYIKDLTTSRSGYIAFYDYKEIVSLEKEDIALDMMLSYLAEVFNRSEYFDVDRYINIAVY